MVKVSTAAIRLTTAQADGRCDESNLPLMTTIGRERTESEANFFMLAVEAGKLDTSHTEGDETEDLEPAHTNALGFEEIIR